MEIYIKYTNLSADLWGKIHLKRSCYDDKLYLEIVFICKQLENNCIGEMPCSKKINIPKRL